MTVEIWLALSKVIYLQVQNFALNGIFFPANEKATSKQNNQSDFKAYLI